MSNDLDLVGGIYPKERHANAPDFVLGKFSINVEQFREWFKAYLAANPGTEWVNIDTLLSKGGKPYARVDDWKPDPNKSAAPAAAPAPVPAAKYEDVPF
jgi:hypothetical protein